MLKTTLAILIASLAYTAFAADSSSRLFKSVDHGATWVRAGEGLPNDVRINAFTAAEGLLVAGLDTGVFVSEDAGATWRRSPTGLDAEPRVLTLASEGARVFAGTQKDGVLVSSDSGASWRAVNDGLTDRYIRTLVIQDGMIYAGANRAGVFVSEDSGESWTLMRNGLPEPCQVFDLVLHKGELFAALYHNGLYRWDAGIKQWSRCGDVVPLEVAATEESLVAGHNPGGVFVSPDGGATWSDGNAGLPHRTPVWTLAADDDLVIVGTTGTIGVEVICLFASSDGGVSWRRSDAGLPRSAAPVSFLMNRDCILVGVVCTQ